MKPGAAIVNTTSIQSKDPSPQLLAYAATKARDLELHRGPGADAGGPGHPRERGGAGPDLDAADPVDDAGEKAASFGEQTSRSSARASPTELAPAFVLLASDDGSYMTGAVMPVTGGKPIL